MGKPCDTRSGAEFERLHVRPRPGRTLLVGSYVTDGKLDRRTLYQDVVGVDLRPGPGVDVVADMERAEFGPFDHIECLSVLEHTLRPWKMAENLERSLRAGGTLYVLVPFVHRPHDYPHDFWRMTVDALPLLFPRISWVSRAYAGPTLQTQGKLPATKVDGYPYHARCDAVGFGFLPE